MAGLVFGGILAALATSFITPGLSSYLGKSATLAISLVLIIPTCLIGVYLIDLTTGPGRASFLMVGKFLQYPLTSMFVGLSGLIALGGVIFHEFQKSLSTGIAPERQLIIEALAILWCLVACPIYGYMRRRFRRALEMTIQQRRERLESYIQRMQSSANQQMQAVWQSYVNTCMRDLRFLERTFAALYLPALDASD